MPGSLHCRYSEQQPLPPVVSVIVHRFGPLTEFGGPLPAVFRELRGPASSQTAVTLPSLTHSNVVRADQSIEFQRSHCRPDHLRLTSTVCVIRPETADFHDFTSRDSVQKIRTYL
jgi:hypothetical protein